MPAQSKADLSALAVGEFEKLERMLVKISPAEALAKDGEDTSIKDVVAHRAHWIDLFLGWYAEGQAGRAVSFPAAGYKWNELKRYNADLRARQSDLGWDQARDMLRRAHGTLVRFLEGLSDDDLYGAPMKGARNAWTTGRWAEAAGPSHYRSATKYIRLRLKTMD